MINNESFDIEVSAEHRLLDLHLKEAYQYRDMIFLLVRRDFVSKYKQTVLGPLWAIIHPFMTTIVYTIIFGNLAKLTTADIPGDFAVPAFLFYMSGNICWGYFSSTVSTTSGTFLSNQGTMGKVYYPRICAPIAETLSRLISFGIQLGMYFVLLLYFYIRGGSDIVLSAKLLLLPLLIFQMMLLSVGIGIIISSVTTKYRDLMMLVGYGLQIWQYATPIAYGLQLIPESALPLYMLNPMTPIITLFRYATLGFGYFNMAYYLLSWLVSILMFFIGLIMFSKIERSFIDII